MPQDDTTARSFEELWQQVVAEPVQPIATGEDDEAGMTVDSLVAWLQRIADNCLADGLISADQHAELGTAAQSYAQILGSVPPDQLAEKLRTLGEIDG